MWACGHEVGIELNIWLYTIMGGINLGGIWQDGAVQACFCGIYTPSLVLSLSTFVCEGDLFLFASVLLPRQSVASRVCETIWPNSKQTFRGEGGGVCVPMEMYLARH